MAAAALVSVPFLIPASLIATGGAIVLRKNIEKAIRANVDDQIDIPSYRSIIRDQEREVMALVPRDVPSILRQSVLAQINTSAMPQVAFEGDLDESGSGSSVTRGDFESTQDFNEFKNIQMEEKAKIESLRGVATPDKKAIEDALKSKLNSVDAFFSFLPNRDYDFDVDSGIPLSIWNKIFEKGPDELKTAKEKDCGNDKKDGVEAKGKQECKLTETRLQNIANQERQKPIFVFKLFNSKMKMKIFKNDSDDVVNKFKLDEIVFLKQSANIFSPLTLKVQEARKSLRRRSTRRRRRKSKRRSKRRSRRRRSRRSRRGRRRRTSRRRSTRRIRRKGRRH